ncbi:hypothetical protein FACS1894166_00690 [Bacilli bacterium]|nr:hypothetical protein FACS1894166_00690 [Bacilli bacterium]
MKSVKKISSLIGLTLLMGGALVSVPFISTSCGSGEKLTSITITNKTALSDKYELPVNQEINPTPKLIVKDNNGKKVHPTFTCSTLPTGLKIDQTSGQISGRPTVVTINPTKICTITAKYGSFSDNVKITIEIVEAPTSIDLADFTSSNTFENAVLTFNTSFVPSSNTNR